MTKVLPSRAKGHLVVAAMRILEHREGRGPRSDEISALLEWGHEETLVVLRGLVDTGVLRMNETPFEVRFERADHLRLEELPAQENERELQNEVEEFQRRSRSRKEELDKMFQAGEGARQRKEKVASLEEEFSEFRKKKAPRSPTD
ncbi:MAG: hypothetical protein KAY32_05650 [Candidatus Eisenbacteria sp.]|nr:hypothetical protein [Candidatus Eisenbacteria bacterium]